MDPNACLERLRVAYVETDHAELQEAAVDLLAWIREGGFIPTVTEPQLSALLLVAADSSCASIEEPPPHSTHPTQENRAMTPEEALDILVTTAAQAGLEDRKVLAEAEEVIRKAIPTEPAVEAPMHWSHDAVEVWRISVASPDTYALLAAVFYWYEDALRYSYHERAPWITHVIRDRRRGTVEVYGSGSQQYTCVNCLAYEAIYIPQLSRR